jgi:hypothetical protein
MTPNVEPLRPSKQAGSTRVYCGTCGHSQFVHEDDGDRRCLYSVCDCNRFVVGAEARDPSARSLPPGIRACSPEGWGTDTRSVPQPFGLRSWVPLRGSGVPSVRYVEDGDDPDERERLRSMLAAAWR